MQDIAGNLNFLRISNSLYFFDWTELEKNNIRKMLLFWPKEFKFEIYFIHLFIHEQVKDLYKDHDAFKGKEEVISYENRN